jgi:hypothetical protein
MSNYFTGAAPLPRMAFGSAIDFSQTPTITPEPTPPSAFDLGSAGAASPTQPGRTPGWGEQAKSLLEGIGKLGYGLGAGIAAARGMPMAGMMLSNYYEDKTGDREQASGSSLEKALKALREAGIISSLPTPKLDETYGSITGGLSTPSASNTIS